VPEPAAGRTGRITRFLGVVAVLVTVIGGGTTLLFSLRPGLKPCLGESDASFTGAPVFPRVRFFDHLVRTGFSREEAGKDPSKNLLGAEVRFSYRTSSFRGAHLPVTWSLVRIERDGTLGPVVRGQDRALATTVTPDACSASGGKDLFVSIPQPGKRYRVVLELYRNRRLDDRLALAETPTFRG
jgi:hypothetical protein